MTAGTGIFFKGTVLLALVLLACVPVCDVVLSLVFSGSAPGQGDTAQQIGAGLVSETIRAAITCYLYSVTEHKGRSLSHGILHGLLYSALIASLYLVLGYFYFQLKSPSRFLMADAFILAVQGVASGAVLYFVFRKPTRGFSTSHPAAKQHA